MTSPAKETVTLCDTGEPIGEEVLTDTGSEYLIEIDDGFIHLVDVMTITLGGWDDKYDPK